MNTQCYSADIRLFPPVVETLARTMPPERAKAMRSYRRHNDKLRCLAGWLFMERALGPDLAPRLANGPYGKPAISGAPHFNLSHAGHYAVLAVSTAPIGVDVEQHREGENCAALAAVVFHPDEQAYYADRPSVRTFFDIWTLKESYLKLLGAGLSVEPSSFALSLDNGAIHLPGQPDIHFRLYDDLPGHSLALCLKGDDAPDAIIPVYC